MIKLYFLKFFFPIFSTLFLYADEDGNGGTGGGDSDNGFDEDDVDSLFDEIDDLLDDKDGEQGRPDSDGGDGGSTDQKSKKEKTSKAKQQFKNFQEHVRQQNETIKSMQEKMDKQDKFISRITGADETEISKLKEVQERQAWEKDTPNQARKLVEESESRISAKLTKLERETALKDIYKDIESEYDVDLKELSPKILPLLDFYNPKQIQQNPKKVLKMCLKTLGKLQKRSDALPDFEQGGGIGRRMSGKAAKKAEDQIRDRILSKVSGKKGEDSNVFNI